MLHFQRHSSVSFTLPMLLLRYSLSLSYFFLFTHCYVYVADDLSRELNKKSLFKWRRHAIMLYLKWTQSRLFYYFFLSLSLFSFNEIGFDHWKCECVNEKMRYWPLLIQQLPFFYLLLNFLVFKKYFFKKGYKNSCISWWLERNGLLNNVSIFWRVWRRRKNCMARDHGAY